MSCKINTAEQIAKIGFDKVSSVSEKLDSVSFYFIDSAKRTHILYVDTIKQLFIYDLPIQIDLNYNDFNLSFDNWKSAIDSLQHFWDLLESINTDCWVIDPQDPICRFDCVFRRIVLPKNQNIRIEIDPVAPDLVPKIQLFGDIKTRQLLKLKISLWSNARSIKSNIEDILDLKLPLKPENQNDSEGLSCGICMSFNLDGLCPDFTCQKCIKCFHLGCLSDWLRSLIDTKFVFQTMIGDCPNCGEKLSLRIEESFCSYFQLKEMPGRALEGKKI